MLKMNKYIISLTFKIIETRVTPSLPRMNYYIEVPEYRISTCKYLTVAEASDNAVAEIDKLIPNNSTVNISVEYIPYE